MDEEVHLSGCTNAGSLIMKKKKKRKSGLKILCEELVLALVQRLSNLCAEIQPLLPSIPVI